MVTVRQTPSGFAELVAAAQDAPANSAALRDLDVAGVGVIPARKPMPAAAALLAAINRPRATIQQRADTLAEYVQSHTGPDGFADLLEKMVEGSVPPDTLALCARGITLQGTARPTVPSSRSAR